MTCSPFDLRDFLLRELTAAEQRQVEDHVEVCAACRQDLDRLRLTRTALSSLADEEIPQRIAFVSDPVFELSPWRRALAALWSSGSRLVFAGAAMLSVALVVSPILRPKPVSPAPVLTISDAEIRQRVEAGVSRAVTDIESQYRARTEQLVKDIEQRDRQERRLLQASYEDDLDRANRKAQNSLRDGYGDSQ
ncbi:MAG TPA: zf-HC2 domain-containing protein [Verrucomicrobiae bacterium]|nr:zf-HC2 domain-containing protein [Verrucomicrobiae bacterium]